MTIAPNINTLWARCFVDELARCGLTDVCIAPGSRSTPLVEAFAAHPQIRDHSLIDERSAAFFGLGLAIATGRPVALVCTSGTAAANFTPAICEASHSAIPLLVLTADRPAHLHDCGASQAMDQGRLYGSFARFFHHVDHPEPTAEKLRYIRALACQAFHESLGPAPGPVHLNFPFRKPLESSAVPPDHRDYVDPDLARTAPLAIDGRPDGAPFRATSRGTPTLSADDARRLFDLLVKAERPLILAGADPRGTRYAAPLPELAAALSIPVIAEPTSGLRGLLEDRPNLFTTGDILFQSAFYDELGAPDLILRTGRPPLNWNAARRVRSWPQALQISLSSAPTVLDPDHLLSWAIQTDELAAIEALLDLLGHDDRPPGDPMWLKHHRVAEDAALASLATEFQSSDRPLTAPDAWNTLATALPDGAGLFVSSSMPIRDLDTFLCGSSAALEIFANRGLNGIDGTIATGLGVAAARGEPTVIVVGDVAFRHDLGSLLLASELGIDATLLVLDNGGGAIFDYLPIAETSPETFRKHFTTGDHQAFAHPPVDPTTWQEPTTGEELRQALEDSLHTPGLQVLRVRTSAELDRRIRDEIRAAAAGGTP